MSNNRDASDSMNGYFYQRYICIYYILYNNEFEYILEEGNEDIDLIKINNQKKVIQVKYCSNSNESLIYDSGLYKVIKSNFKNNEIDEIDYYAYNNNNEIYQKDLYNVFKNKSYDKIGKYFLLITYKKINDDKNKKINDDKNKKINDDKNKKINDDKNKI
ncbi:hypothetical protein [Chlorella virus XW01]|nr:hypothetical protein [Chlorella virus XW01]